MQMAAGKRIGSTRWFLPVFTLFLWLVIGAAQWRGGDLQTGLTSLALFIAIAAVLFLGGRSETIRAIRGDGRDERWARIDLAATALSGLTVITAVIVACIWEWAHGRDGSPTWRWARSAASPTSPRSSSCARVPDGRGCTVGVRPLPCTSAQPTPGEGAYSPRNPWLMIC